MYRRVLHEYMVVEHLHKSSRVEAVTIDGLSLT
jgi:hypothetical protein